MIKAIPHKIILILLTLVFSVAYSNDIFHAKIYPDGAPKQLAYTHTNTVEHSNDSTVLTHFYYTPDNKLYVKDIVILYKDNPIYNSLEFYQTKDYYSCEIVGENANMYYKGANKSKRVTRDVKDPLVFAPTQQEGVRNYLDDLKAGKSAHFYIFATEVLRLVDMEVEIIENSKYERPDCIVLIMHPKSMFIDWFVDEVFYVIDKSNGRIIEMHGFSTLKLKVDNKWEFRDMDFYYSYE
jgi:hypothetical protein